MGAAVEAFGMSLNGARRVRFWNAVTAAFCGVLPALVLIWAYPSRWRLLLAGMLIGFGVSFIITEEVHWRSHLGGWLTPALSAARAYHLRHHDTPDARFNVVLPIFDLLFGNLGAEGYTEKPRQPLRERALGLFRAATEGALVYTYLIAAFIFFWCSFPAPARRRTEERRIQAESPKNPS